MGDEDSRPIVITPLVATLLGAFVTLVLSGAGYMIAELRATAERTDRAREATFEQVERVRVAAKTERDRYRDEILTAIADLREAARLLEDRMFSKKEQAIYNQTIIEGRATLEAKINALEATIRRHLDTADIQSVTGH